VNLSDVNEALSWHPATECRTCGGTIHFEARLAPDNPGINITATCHGMWGAFFIGLDGRRDEDFFDWLSLASRMPEKVPEYDITDEMPTVSAKTKFVISERSASAARIGAIMQVGGVQGRVTGINRVEHAIWLEP